MLKKLLIITTGLLLVSACSQDRAESKKTSMLPDTITNAVKARMNADLYPGIAIAVISDNNYDYFTRGFTEVEGGVPVTETTLFEIGSATKVFTGLLLAQMVQSGRLQMYDFLTQHFRRCNFSKTPFQQTTLEALATHASRLPRLPANFKPKDLLRPYEDFTMAKVCEGLTISVPEADYMYSNFGYGVLGHALEDASGQSLEALMQAFVLAPLEMGQTTFVLDEKNPQLSQGHYGHKATPYWRWKTLAAAGGLKSSLQDMARFMAFQLSPPESALGEAIRMTQQRRHPTDLKDIYMGLGWHIIGTKEKDIFLYHNGQTGGFYSFIGMNKLARKAVVILTNTSFSVEDMGLHMLNSQVPLVALDDLIKAYEVLNE